jgi:hypothetical protein
LLNLRKGSERAVAPGIILDEFERGDLRHTRIAAYSRGWLTLNLGISRLERLQSRRVVAMARVKLDKARSALLDRLETMFANSASK